MSRNLPEALNMAKKEDNAVPIEFLSHERLEDKSLGEKLDLIFEKAREREIVVLEEALTPSEKRILIERSMEEADEDFPGIEFMGFDGRSNWLDDVLEKFLGREKREGLVVVGSSDMIEKVREEKDSISFLAKME